MEVRKMDITVRVMARRDGRICSDKFEFVTRGRTVWLYEVPEELMATIELKHTIESDPFSADGNIMLMTQREMLREIAVRPIGTPILDGSDTWREDGLMAGNLLQLYFEEDAGEARQNPLYTGRIMSADVCLYTVS